MQRVGPTIGPSIARDPPISDIPFMPAPVRTLESATTLDVLLIDDDELLCTRMEKLLESQGIGCLSVHKLASAREAMKAVHFPLVILDRRLGDGDGLDFCGEYRALRSDRPVSILVYSAMSTEDQVAAALAAGADDHIAKSCGDPALLAKIGELLERSEPSVKSNAQTRGSDKPAHTAPPVPLEELARARALHAYSILDTLAEQAFDDITRIASCLCRTPIALISFVDGDRQWFKSAVGLEVEQTPRENAFCAHAIASPAQTLIVSDARNDPRFAHNPLVTGAPYIRFYAGVPLVSPDGHAIGTVCVVDDQPRELQPRELQALEALARQVMVLLEQRRAKAALDEAVRARLAADAELERSQTLFREAYENAPIGIALVSTNGTWLRVNRSLCNIVGYASDELLRTTFQAITYPDDLNTDLQFVQQVLDGAIPGYEMEKRYVHKAGHLVWVLLTVSLVRDPSGKPAFFISHIQDISQRKRLEAGARQ
jgi:PAS domain S-box-containing protein